MPSAFDNKASSLRFAGNSDDISEPSLTLYSEEHFIGFEDFILDAGDHSVSVSERYLYQNCQHQQYFYACYADLPLSLETKIGQSMIK